VKIHFLDVGQGDCTIIEFPSGRIGMVDIDNLDCLDATTEEELRREYTAESGLLGIYATLLRPYEQFRKKYAKLTDPLQYYKAVIAANGNRDIFRMIITHPDMDHMSGLHRIHEQEPTIEIINFWHTGNHNFDMDTNDWTNCPYDEKDWLTYKKLRDGTQPKSLHQQRGNTGVYWTEDGIELWSPTTTLEQQAEECGEKNILSMILKITYLEKSILLGGDATADETWPDVMQKVSVGKVDVLKASHHGRHTGYCQPAVKAMSPWLTITSVGEAEQDATPKYREYSEHTVSLRRAGDIQLTIDDTGTLYYPKAIEQYWKDKL